MSSKNKTLYRLFHSGCLLGGSRRMAEKYPETVIINDATDWDLYCEDSEEKRSLALKLGFRQIKVEDLCYRDKLLAGMFVHDDYNIQVLLRTDVALYRKVYESFSEYEYHAFVWKRGRILTKSVALNKRRGTICEYINKRIEFYSPEKKVEEGMWF